ncbi:MAG TPA: sigma-70 family RNA polymerase sigma factor [Aggregatilineales bacterium]|nr:sigma-70 family RNA polymerase sigma factor [Aggregatilineales bacterium]
MDDTALIQKAQRGDVDSFNALVIQYQANVYNFVYRLLGDAEIAADATQDAFISAWSHLVQFRGGSFKAWLMRIAANTCYDEMRRRRRRPSVSLDEPESEGNLRLVSDSESPESAAQRSALSRLIQECLDALTPDQRLVAVLCDVQGYNYAEIAEIRRLSLGTVKSRLSRARQNLRDCLRGAGELLPDAYRLDQRED